MLRLISSKNHLLIWRCLSMHENFDVCNLKIFRAVSLKKYYLSQNFKVFISAEITSEQECLWEIWFFPTVQIITLYVSCILAWSSSSNWNGDCVHYIHLYPFTNLKIAALETTLIQITHGWLIRGMVNKILFNTEL